MAENIHQRLKELGVRESKELTLLFDAVLNDLTELRTELAAVIVDAAAYRASIVGITAKLDLDAGVTDTNYASLHDPAAATATAPAALELES